MATSNIMFLFLDELKASGTVQMPNIKASLMQEFGIPPHRAREVLIEWHRITDQKEKTNKLAAIASKESPTQINLGGFKVNKKEKFIKKDDRMLAIESAVFEIEQYLKEGQPSAVIELVLNRLAEKYGDAAEHEAVDMVTRRSLDKRS